MRTKILFCWLILCPFLNANAQIEKGTLAPGVLLSGSFSARPYRDSLNAQQNYSGNLGINLRCGVFVRKNLMLTPMINYSYNYSSQMREEQTSGSNPMLFDNTSSNYTHTIGTGIGLNKYCFISEQFAFTFGGAFTFSYGEGIQSSENKTTAINVATFTDNETHSYHNTVGESANLNIGIQYFLTKNLALTGNMGLMQAQYTSSPYSKKHNVESSNLQVTFNPSFNFFSAGLMYYIRPKTKEEKQP